MLKNRQVYLILAFLLLLPGCQKSYRDVEISRGGIQIPERQRDYWPTESWKIEDPLVLGWDKGKLDTFESLFFQDPFKTDALLVIHNGRIIVEKYGNGYEADSLHYTWSISKSVTSTLIGIAEKKGLLSRTQFLSDFIDDFKDDNKKSITIDHLLRMESGLSWKETYEYAPLYSNVIKMLYTIGSSDMGLYSSKVKMEALPGSFLKYSSGTTNILSLALKRAIGNRQEYLDFPWQELFDPLGIKTAVWELDGSDTFVGSSYLHTTARDLAKIAYLHLNNGIWDGRQILPDNWMFTATTDTMQARTVVFREAYGAQWYMNYRLSSQDSDRKFPSLPENIFWASGHWGQAMFVFPEQDLIIVRFGDDRRERPNFDKLFSLLLEAQNK